MKYKYVDNIGVVLNIEHFKFSSPFKAFKINSFVLISFKTKLSFIYKKNS